MLQDGRNKVTDDHPAAPASSLKFQSQNPGRYPPPGSGRNLAEEPSQPVGGEKGEQQAGPGSCCKRLHPETQAPVTLALSESEREVGSRGNRKEAHRLLASQGCSESPSSPTEPRKRGRTAEEDSGREGDSRAASMGTEEGLCLLLCLVLSGAAETSESGESGRAGREKS
ncbi:hypothetical protein P7K49_019163 [Saguinus oedipus]|uniref:Uncharacterized protein n=1 Tax=Saguinus oedipus TaxID=9490 RepID=A0ABQ9UZ43_SAGOE|nr:hypothetical protein P7K49_019163 [Saguinus oedipus]